MNDKSDGDSTGQDVVTGVWKAEVVGEKNETSIPDTKATRRGGRDCRVPCWVVVEPSSTREACRSGQFWCGRTMPQRKSLVDTATRR